MGEEKLSLMRHNYMRHNNESGPASSVRAAFRGIIVALACVGVIAFSADMGYSQSKNASHKTAKKTGESKRKEAKQVKEKEQAEDTTAAAEQVALDDKKDEKKEEKQEGDLNMGDYGEDDFRPQVEEESTVWLIFKTIFVLGSIIGGFYFFFKFVTKKTGIQLLGQEVVKILSVVPLGQNKYIQVVDMAGKVLVLGITDNAINVLSEIHDKDEIDRMRLLSSKTVAQRVGGFQEYLTAQMGRMIEKVAGFRHRSTPTVVEEDQEAGDLDYLRAHRQRIRELNGNNGEEK